MRLLLNVSQLRELCIHINSNTICDVKLSIEI
jgi:hypothetical protein